MDVMRATYRELTDEEKELMDSIKFKAELLHAEFDKIRLLRHSRLAKTKLEEAVMWAVKGVTG